MTRPLNAAAAPAGWSRCPHFFTALGALAVGILLLGGVEAFTRWKLPHELNRFAEEMNSAKLLGNVQQVAAFHTRRVLPLYGSSELENVVDNRAEEFFLAHPEGMRVFPIGRPGNSSLLILEKLAAAGPAVRGKKVGIFLSPNWFLRKEMHDAQVEDNVTPTQLGAWLFGNSLSGGFKQRFARRLLEHSEGLQSEPMLTLCLRCVASGTFVDRCRLGLLAPIGELRGVLLTRMDFWAAFHALLLERRPAKPPVEQRWRRPAYPLNDAEWTHLAEKAEVFDRQRGLENAYSVVSPVGAQAEADRTFLRRHRDGSYDVEFEKRLEHSDEWGDLALLIDGLKELGADAVFISQPFNGIYHDLGGLSAAARRRYYDRVAEMVRPSGYPLVDFSAHEEDKYFFNDANHPSAKAWIYYDQALDNFYHRSRSASAHRS